MCKNLIITIVTTWPRKYIFQIQTVTKIRLNSPLFISLAFGEIDKNLNYIWPNLEKNNSKRDAVKYPTFSLSILLNISIFPSWHNNEISHQNIEKHGGEEDGGGGRVELKYFSHERQWSKLSTISLNLVRNCFLTALIFTK